MSHWKREDIERWASGSPYARQAPCPTCGSLPADRKTVEVGDVLHGYCGGYFGRDAYECKTVEAVGPDWIVARTNHGYVTENVVTATGRSVRTDLARYRELDPGDSCNCEE